MRTLSTWLNVPVRRLISNQSWVANMSDGAHGTGSAHPTAEEVRQLLERILCSRQFSNAPKKQKFLQLICEAYLDGRASELSEYSIGYQVFDRSETYDPALDSISWRFRPGVISQFSPDSSRRQKLPNPQRPRPPHHRCPAMLAASATLPERPGSYCWDWR